VETDKFSVMIDIFVDTLMYEPTTVTDSTNITYIYKPPDNILHDYIKHFNNNIKYINNINIDYTEPVVGCCQCVGTGDIPHLILEAEGICCCSECGETSCLQCILCDDENSEIKFCYKCYLSHCSVEKNSLEELTSTTTSTLQEARRKLNMLGYSVPTEYKEINLMDDYDTIVTYETIINVYDEKMLKKKITVLTHNTDYLQDLRNNTLFSFTFADGASFVVDKSMSGHQIIEILKTISSLVMIYDNNTINDTSKKNIRTKIYPRPLWGLPMVHECIKMARADCSDEVLYML
jgi:hypothetical protein